MSDPQAYNEKELLRQVAAGDERAFSALFNLFKNKVFSLSAKLTGSTVLSEDIVQEVFLKLWLKRRELESIENLTGYLLTITKHSILNELRSQTRNRKKNDDYAGQPDLWIREQQQDPLLEKEAERIIQDAIRRLPEQQRTVYRLMREEGLKREETAQRLNIRPETVKKHLALATRTIRSFYLANLDKVVEIIILVLIIFDFTGSL